MSDEDELLIERTLASLDAQFFVRGWLSSNNILFAGLQQTTTVVDTGYSTHAAQTINLLQRSLRGRDLDHIVNTHLHSDHCGGNAALLAQWPSARINVPHGYADCLSPWDEDKLSFRECDQHCPPFPAHHYLKPGQEIQLGNRTWQIHATGGHDPDAVILFEPQSATLISGDALWQDRLAIIFPELKGQNGFDAAAATLDLIEKLSPRLVLPGHGLAFTDVSQALQASRRRLQAYGLNPIRHGQHAARALLMYHMLEHQTQTRGQLLDWMVGTPIFHQALKTNQNRDVAYALATETLQRLITDGTLQQQDAIIKISY